MRAAEARLVHKLVGSLGVGRNQRTPNLREKCERAPGQKSFSLSLLVTHYVKAIDSTSLRRIVTEDERGFVFFFQNEERENVARSSMCRPRYCRATDTSDFSSRNEKVICTQVYTLAVDLNVATRKDGYGFDVHTRIVPALPTCEKHRKPRKKK